MHSHAHMQPLALAVPLCRAQRRALMDVRESASETSFEPRIGRSVSLDHAAELLGVSRRTIYNRIREGRLQTVRTLGGSQRVVLDSVHGVRGQFGNLASGRHAF